MPLVRAQEDREVEVVLEGGAGGIRPDERRLQLGGAGWDVHRNPPFLARVERTVFVLKDDDLC